MKKNLQRGGWLEQNPQTNTEKYSPVEQAEDMNSGRAMTTVIGSIRFKKQTDGLYRPWWG